MQHAACLGVYVQGRPSCRHRAGMHSRSPAQLEKSAQQLCRQLHRTLHQLADMRS